MWWDILIATVAGLLAAWVALLIALLVIRPKGALLSEAMRLLPDLVRLLRRLAADKTLPKGVRVRLGLLMAYLVLPIDLIPDFLPVIGHADDAIIVAFTLRSVVRRAGIEAVRAHWPGTDDGFAVLSRLTGLNRAADGTSAALPDPQR
ncbi:YkvA family protein [Streptomyces sp. NPDC004227]